MELNLDFSALQSNPIFKGFTQDDFSFFENNNLILEKNLEKGQMIFHAGQVTDEICLVKQGQVQIEMNDFWGSRTVFDRIGTGGIFAETYALTGEPFIIDVVALEKSDVFVVPMAKVRQFGEGDVTPCKIAPLVKFYSNLLQISLNKNLNLSRKIMHTSFKSVRGRLVSFLSYYAKKTGSSDFMIPFDRQTLADYLNIDRSAMSNELGKMKEEGLLETRKNHFLLKKSFDL